MPVSIVPVISIVLLIIVTFIILGLAQWCRRCVEEHLGKEEEEEEEDEPIPSIEGEGHTLVHIESHHTDDERPWYQETCRKKRQTLALEALLDDRILLCKTLRGKEIIHCHDCAWCVKPIRHNLGYWIKSDYYHLGCGLYGILRVFLVERELLLEQLLPSEHAWLVISFLLERCVDILPRPNHPDTAALWY